MAEKNPMKTNRISLALAVAVVGAVIASAAEAKPPAAHARYRSRSGGAVKGTVLHADRNTVILKVGPRTSSVRFRHPPKRPLHQARLPRGYVKIDRRKLKASDWLKIQREARRK